MLGYPTDWGQHACPFAAVPGVKNLMQVELKQQQQLFPAVPGGKQPESASHQLSRGTGESAPNRETTGGSFS